jgi:glutaredoxin 3
MTQVIVYSTEVCPYCQSAKQLLKAKGLTYQEILVDKDPALRDDMIAKSGRRTVPQIFINGQSIGGFDDLAALEKAGKLDVLIGKA